MSSLGICCSEYFCDALVLHVACFRCVAGGVPKDFATRRQGRTTVLVTVTRRDPPASSQPICASACLPIDHVLVWSIGMRQSIFPTFESFEAGMTHGTRERLPCKRLTPNTSNPLAPPRTPRRMPCLQAAVVTLTAAVSLRDLRPSLVDAALLEIVLCFYVPGQLTRHICRERPCVPCSRSTLTWLLRNQACGQQ